MTKLCKGCLVEKAPSKFFAEQKNKDRLYGKCKICVYGVQAEYRLNNPKKIAALGAKAGAKWAKKNPKKVAAINARSGAKWRKKNPDKLAIKDARRRARKLAAPGGHHTHKERLAKFKEFDNICAYFPRKGCTKVATTVDHVLALANGGSNEISNCVPACNSCNCAKGAKLDWTPRNPKILIS